MSPKKRQKKITKPATASMNIELNTQVLSDLEEKDKDQNLHVDVDVDVEVGFHDYNQSLIDKTIMHDQDEEYEMSVIMDIIKMQEKEEHEKREKEKQEKQDQEKILKISIEKRDHNIKEILRKLKFLANTQSCFEKKLVSILENIMGTQDLHITIHDNDLYLEIQSYLGLNNNKGTIRLHDEVKEYANKMFILECNFI